MIKPIKCPKHTLGKTFGPCYCTSVQPTDPPKPTVSGLKYDEVLVQANITLQARVSELEKENSNAWYIHEHAENRINNLEEDNKLLRKERDIILRILDYPEHKHAFDNLQLQRRVKYCIKILAEIREIYKVWDEHGRIYVSDINRLKSLNEHADKLLIEFKDIQDE